MTEIIGTAIGLGLTVGLFIALVLPDAWALALISQQLGVQCRVTVEENDSDAV